MSVEVTVALCILLIVTTALSLFLKTTSLSLIMLFYSSVALNIIFTIYGATIIALIHLIVFAGAISVMLLTTVVITGEANLAIGEPKKYVILVVSSIILASIFGIFLSGKLRPAIGTGFTGELLEFVWTYRPWDLLILIIILAASMATVMNILSRTGE